MLAAAAALLTASSCKKVIGEGDPTNRNPQHHRFLRGIIQYRWKDLLQN
jgi:hypothetical protein